MTPLLALLTQLTLAAPDPAAVVHLTVAVQSNRGQVMCALYNSDETWLSKKVVTGTKATIKGRRAVCEFPGLPKGRYAISVFHDEDMDNELDTNLIGIPTEDYGASNNARANFGPPSFDDAAFVFRGGQHELFVTTK